MDANAFYQKYGFKITDSVTHGNEEYGITPEIQKILDKEVRKLQRGVKGTTKRLKMLIGKYPHVPHFKNYLSAVYQSMGQTERAYQVNREIRELHPEYLYGKFNLANEYIHTGQLEQVPILLGKNLKINELLPDRAVFHVNEVVNYYDVVFRYYLVIKEDKKAQGALETMEAADIDHPNTRRNAMALIAYRAEHYEELFESREEVETLSYDQSVQTSEPPQFHFIEMEELYRNSLDISPEITQKILSFPRKPLIEDLEKVVNDALFRYEYWSDYNAAIDEWDEKIFNFPLHAIFLLVELDAKESLPVIWNLIKQGDELCSFYFEDHLTETLWEAFYLLGKDNLELLKTYALEPNIYGFSKSPIHQAVSQILLYEPERRTEVLNWYESILKRLIERVDAGEEPPYEEVASLVMDLTNLNAKELLPLIRVVYEKDMVDEFVAGEYEDTIEHINRKKESYVMKRHDDFHARWKYISDTWFGYQPKENRPLPPPIPISKSIETVNSKPKLDKKVGRNDPCVCGSGKKFKKCCIRKYA